MRPARAACAGVVLALLAGGCQKAPPDAVVAMRDFHRSLPEVASEFERVNGAGSFDTASVVTRERFARTLADREILLRVARRSSLRLAGRQDRQYRVLREKYLYREYLEHRRETFRLPPAVEAENLPRLQREAVVRQFAILEMAPAQEAERAIAAGASFEDLAGRFAASADPPAPGRSGGSSGRKWRERVVRVDDRRIPPRIIIDALLRDLPPGAIAGPTMTMEGYLVTQVQSYRPLPVPADSVWLGKARAALEMLAYMNVYDGWVDSLKQAAGFGFHPEAYPVVQARFAAFWDSIDALRQEGRSFDFQAARSPVWRFSPEEQAAPLYEMNGTRTIGDYARGLDSVDLDYWPTSGGVEKIGRQIEARVNRLLLQAAAAREGFDRSEKFRAAIGSVEERLLLDQLYEETTRDVRPPSAEEIAAEYRRLADTLRTPDLLSFSALIYPPKAEERARAALARLRGGPPLLWLELAPAEAAADTTIRYVPATELLNSQLPPPDPRWTALFRAARSLGAGEISDLLPITDGGLAIVRVADRRPSHRMTLEEATPTLRTHLEQSARDGKIEELLRRERKRLGLRVFTDRLKVS